MAAPAKVVKVEDKVGTTTESEDQEMERETGGTGGGGRGKQRHLSKLSTGNGNGPKRSKGTLSNRPSTHSAILGPPPPPSLPLKMRPSMDKDESQMACSTNVHGTIEPDLGLLDDMDPDMEPQVSQLLNQLSSQIQHRVRTKKQRLDQNFQAVYSIPARILGLQNDQRANRERVISEFKQMVGSINEKLNEIVQMQQRNEEKQGKMIIALTRENDDMKKLVSECNDLQSNAFTKFLNGDKTLTKQIEAEAAQDADLNNKNIQVLQRKLLADGQKEGSEALYNLHRYI